MTQSRTGKLYQPLTIYLEADQHRRAKALGVNFTQAARDGVALAIDAAEQENTSSRKLSRATSCQTN